MSDGCSAARHLCKRTITSRAALAGDGNVHVERGVQLKEHEEQTSTALSTITPAHRYKNDTEPQVQV